MLNPQLMQQLKSIAQSVSTAQNPQLALNQIIMNNPQFAQAFNLIKLMGGDPKTTYYNYARQMGVDPDNFLQTVKQSLS